MIESKRPRYTVSTSGLSVVEYVEGAWVADCYAPKDATRIARLLNAESEVRAALSLALERFTDPESPDGNRIRSALSALGEE